MKTKIVNLQEPSLANTMNNNLGQLIINSIQMQTINRNTNMFGSAPTKIDFT